MKAFVIVWIMTMSVGESSDDILVQFGAGGTAAWFDTMTSCEYVLSEYEPRHLVDEFIAYSNGLDVEWSVVKEPHCTEFDTYNHTYPDYPEFDISPENLEKELQT